MAKRGTCNKSGRRRGASPLETGAGDRGIGEIVAFIQALVRIPSRGGEDPYGEILETTQNWLRNHGVEVQTLTRESEIAGVAAVVRGLHSGGGGAVYMLNATLDTAGFGDETRWRRPPTSAHVENGWMFGRGAADSKAGVALFSALTADFVRRREEFSGTLVLLLDLDEHTGRFGGVKRYFSAQPELPRPHGAFIGYPGNDRIVIGSRGFARARVSVHGRAAHSAGTRERGVNAVLRAAELTLRLSSLHLQASILESFPLPPQVTVTEIHGGNGFSIVPDLCMLGVDMRLTPSFDAELAMNLLVGAVTALDEGAPECPRTSVQWLDTWPAYRIDDGDPIVCALTTAAEREFQRSIPREIVGPSNIGNYLATLGIPAIAGFGVSYFNAHALDECIDLSTIAPVYRTYRAALDALLGASPTRKESLSKPELLRHDDKRSERRSA